MHNSSFTQDDLSIVQAENEFARMACAVGFRTAFLKNLDAAGLVFENGNAFNGVEYFMKSLDDPGKLLWHPVMAMESLSGDLGFTTGGFEYRKNLSSSVSSAGQYSSVWRREKHGSWKLLLDMGIDFEPSVYTDLIQTKIIGGLVPASEDDCWKCQEADFLKRYAKDGPAAFETVIAPDSWLNLQGRHPFCGAPEIMLALSDAPRDLVFTPIGSGISAARDLFYVYGETRYQDRRENYLRVWIHRPLGWKIVLQVLRW